jgi:uncharacterized membrane protein YsdA (DUF1294 family)
MLALRHKLAGLKFRILLPLGLFLHVTVTIVLNFNSL